MKQKWDAVQEELKKLGVQESDLIETFILGSGKGGQNLHKTSSCVHLRHPSSQIEIKCQKTRSKELNRLYARRELCRRLDLAQKGAGSKEGQRIARVRKQKKRRARRRSKESLGS